LSVVKRTGTLNEKDRKKLIISENIIDDGISLEFEKNQ
jgi:hypothetical protein